MMQPSQSKGRFSRGTALVLTVGIVAIGATGILTAEVDTTKQAKTDHPILAPCTRFDSRYDSLGFKDKYLEDIPDIYHETVDKVIEDHLKPPTSITCSAQDYGTFMAPGTELSSLARKLPPWSDSQTPLTRHDIGRVLLEYLRVYECILYEYGQFTSEETQKEISDQEDKGIRQADPNPEIAKLFLNVLLGEFNEEVLKRQKKIIQERVVARKALVRALNVVSSVDRLRPVEMELQCMQQMSLDIRNISALAAETSSCLPRAWNAKDILRDLAP